MDQSVTSGGARPWALHLGTMAALAGMLLCLALCHMHLVTDAAGCPAGGGCARVMASRWSAPLGIPLALAAFVYEALLLQALARACVTPSATVRRWLRTLLIAGCAAVGLSLLLMLHLGAACPMCLLLDAALLAQAGLLGAWLRVQMGAADVGLGAPTTPAILRVVYPLIFVPTFLVVAVDLDQERDHGRVVASANGLQIHRRDLERMGAGMRQADRALDTDIDRALVRRRLDIGLITERAAAAGEDGPAYLRAQAQLAPGTRDPAAEQAAVERIHADADVQLPPPRPAVVQPGDSACSWSDGAADAPIRILAVIRADCGVCASQVRELAWCRAHSPGWGTAAVRISVLIASDEAALAAPTLPPAANEQAGAAALARAVAAAGPHGASRSAGTMGQAWSLLMRICSTADPSDITYAQIEDWLRADGVDPALLASTSLNGPREQARAAARLLGRAGTPQLFLQDMPLGGYCPRERLAGAIAEAQALLAGHAVVDELDPESQLPATAAVVSSPIIPAAP